jgi:hypothetical protein
LLELGEFRILVTLTVVAAPNSKILFEHEEKEETAMITQMRLMHWPLN